MKDELLKNWLWKMEVLDKTKITRIFTIRDYSNLRSIIEYGERQAKRKSIQEEIKWLRGMLQNKNGRELSKARAFDTGHRTIPDLYDMRIKERIKQLKKQQEI